MKSNRTNLFTLLFAALTLASCAAPPSDFTLKSATDEKTFTLSQASGKMVALHFLLKTECPVCLNHTREYMTKAPQLLPEVTQVFIKPDTEEEVKKWSSNLPTSGSLATTIYRDPEAQLAKQYDIPGGYQFHGQSMHYPALVLLDGTGKEVFRYVGKSNSDRFGIEQLKAKVDELSKN